MYRSELSDAAQARLIDVPYEWLDDLVETIVQACIDPWNFQRREDEPLDRHYAHRWVKFAGGRGKLWFHVRDGEGLLWITEIEWQE